MWTEFVSFNSNVLVLNVQVKKYTIFCLSVLKYEGKSKSFIVSSKKEQIIQSILPEINKISCLGFEVLLDHHYGIFIPYFVVQDPNFCCFFHLNFNNEWKLRYKFAVPEKIALCETSYSIANGPTLIWTVGNKISIYKAEYSQDNLKGPLDGILTVQLDLICGKSSEISSRILWWKSCVRCFNDPEQGMVVFMDNEAQILNSYLITVDNEGRKADVMLPNLIPFQYLSITSCAVVIPGHLLTAQSNATYRMFLTTTHSQLLEFHQ